MISSLNKMFLYHYCDTFDYINYITLIIGIVLLVKLHALWINAYFSNKALTTQVGASYAVYTMACTIHSLELSTFSSYGNHVFWD